MESFSASIRIKAYQTLPIYSHAVWFVETNIYTLAALLRSQDAKENSCDSIL